MVVWAPFVKRGRQDEGATYERLLDLVQVGFTTGQPRLIRRPDAQRHGWKFNLHL
jgi:hypothetical protein